MNGVIDEERTTASDEIVWTEEGNDRWVAHEQGEYAGMVERDERYTLLDGMSFWVGYFATLREAQDALVPHRDRVRARESRSRRRERAVLVIAAAIGAAALLGAIVTGLVWL